MFIQKRYTLIESPTALTVFLLFAVAFSGIAYLAGVKTLPLLMVVFLFGLVLATVAYWLGYNRQYSSWAASWQDKVLNSHGQVLDCIRVGVGEMILIIGRKLKLLAEAIAACIR